jgi:ABC-type cobalamin transport system ATPase subunit
MSLLEGSQALEQRFKLDCEAYGYASPECSAVAGDMDLAMKAEEYLADRWQPNRAELGQLVGAMQKVSFLQPWVRKMELKQDRQGAKQVSRLLTNEAVQQAYADSVRRASGQASENVWQRLLLLAVVVGLMVTAFRCAMKKSARFGKR